jgi:WD40 repeat protein
MAEHQHAVNSLSVSHSRCNWFASASSDGTVKLWGCAKEGAHIDKVCSSSLKGPSIVLNLCDLYLLRAIH